MKLPIPTMVSEIYIVLVAFFINHNLAFRMPKSFLAMKYIADLTDGQHK